MPAKPVTGKKFPQKMDSKTRKNAKYRKKKNTKTVQQEIAKTRSKTQLIYESENIIYSELDECGDDELISQKTLKELCRVCLKNDMHLMFPLSSIFATDDYSVIILDALKCITSQEVDADDKLPSQVCFNCLERIINAYLLIVQYEENYVKLEEMITIFDKNYEIEYLDKDSNASDCMIVTHNEEINSEEYQFNTDASKQNGSSKMISENENKCTNYINSHEQTVKNDEIWLDLNTTNDTEYMNNESNETDQKNNAENIIQMVDDSSSHNEYFEIIFENSDECDLPNMVTINKQGGNRYTQLTDADHLNNVTNEIAPFKLNNSTEPVEDTIYEGFSTTISELNESHAVNEDSEIYNSQELVNTDKESELTAPLNNHLNELIVLNKENMRSNLNDGQSNSSGKNKQNEEQSSLPLKNCNESSKNENTDINMINIDNNVSTDTQLIKIKEEPVDLYENRIKCRQCKVTMLKSEITAHMVRCKMKKKNTEGSDTKLKLIICKHCNTLLYLNDMLQHSTNCKKLLEETLKKISASSSEYIKDETVAHDTTDHSMNQVKDKEEISDIIIDPNSTITYRKIDNISNKRTNNNISNKLTLYTDEKSSPLILNSSNGQKEIIAIQNGTKKSTRLNNSTESTKETANIEIRKRKSTDVVHNHATKKKVVDFVEVCNICNEIFTNIGSFRRHSKKHNVKT